MSMYSVPLALAQAALFFLCITVYFTLVQHCSGMMQIRSFKEAVIAMN